MHNQFIIRVGYAIFSLIFPSKFYNKENFPKGKAVIIANHYSVLDPCFIFGLTKKEVYFLAKKEAIKENWTGKFLRSLGAIPIDRENNDVRAMMTAMKVIKGDTNNKLVIFPEGTRNKVDNNIQELKGGAGLFAVRTKTPIVPMIFYRKAKAFRRTKIILGEPFELTEFYDKKIQKEDVELIDKILREKMVQEQEKLYAIINDKKKKGNKCK